MPERFDSPTGPVDAAASKSAVTLHVDRRLLEILVCPVTRGPLEYVRATNTLLSRQAGLAYPIRDGIPIMLAEEGTPMDDTVR